MPDFLFKMTSQEKYGLRRRAKEERGTMTEVLHTALQTYLSGSIGVGLSLCSGTFCSGSKLTTGTILTIRVD